MQKYPDAAVIEGGPAGRTAAPSALRRGAKAILFDKERMGGTCLNAGCSPTQSQESSATFLKQTQKDVTQTITDHQINTRKGYKCLMYAA
jgi:pyruvate/2-oxoglutarate dehydrogenase complex dihydrolipoamide dehydrogenase (E3) component